MRRIIRWLLFATFALAGVMHFVNPAPFVAIYPEGWPASLEMVYVSGTAEVIGAVGLLIPKTRLVAAFGLILLLVAVFPANLNMALHANRFSQFPEWLLLLRLPLQPLLIILVWYVRRG